MWLLEYKQEAQAAATESARRVGLEPARSDGDAALVGIDSPLHTRWLHAPGLGTELEPAKA